jgi:acyl-CoA synthetase (AMP-forming)/AMP-acid ligase II
VVRAGRQAVHPHRRHRALRRRRLPHAVRPQEGHDHLGGFNIYPSDLEAELRKHPAVAEAAVVGVPSEQWGETPVAFVVRRAGETTPAATLREWLNTRVGRTQRLADLVCVDELPRSAIGKVLKRELRDRYGARHP